eukprot:TRINITY_DN12480_c0_g1_i1.p1 TRINITY_DN12480_c0_g1~~TRINITY_DN12480_c0_g1_i1.p1  ORF type:complete len:213 (+),score=1.91 TRINITY_DN12480_c0_g1_i1:24-662(+)
MKLVCLLSLLIYVALSKKCNNVIKDPSFEEFTNVATCDRVSQNPLENPIICQDVTTDGKRDVAIYRRFGPWYGKGSDFESGCQLGNAVSVVCSNAVPAALPSIKDGRQAATLSAGCTYKLCQDVKGLKEGKSYTLSFFAIKPIASVGTDDFVVIINNKRRLNVATSEIPTKRWEKYNVHFTSNGKEDTICFFDIDDPTDFNSALIDQVELCA